MSWKRVRGHDDAVRLLERAWQRNRLAHAYLFVGPSGVGKKLFATELAKVLLCEVILVGTSAERHVERVVARCQVVGFGAVPDEYVRVGRRRRAREEEALPRLTRLAGGRRGLAIALAEPALWEFRRTLLAGLM